MQIVAADNVAETAAELLADRLRELTKDGRRASIAISGGETPWPTLNCLACLALPWEAIDLYQVDERIVPADDPARNLARLRSVLADRVPVRLHPMPVEAADLDRAAADYAAALPAELDIVQLGLGGDGHTASLVPGDAALSVTGADVALTAPYQGNRRMTLTYPALNRAGMILWLVSGSGKREALGRLLAGSAAIPASGIAREQAIVVADRAALGPWSDPAQTRD